MVNSETGAPLDEKIPIFTEESGDKNFNSEMDPELSAQKKENKL
jgi:hypothetical protein